MARIHHLELNYYSPVGKDADVLRFSNQYYYDRPAGPLEPLEP